MVMVRAAVTIAHIHRPWGQNKCLILSRKYLKDCIEELGRQKISAADHGHSNMIQHHRTQHVSNKNGLTKRFLASFLPHNGNRNHRISIRWTFAPGAFWGVRFSLKNTKLSIISRRRFDGREPKYRRATFVRPMKAIIRTKGGQFEQI